MNMTGCFMNRTHAGDMAEVQARIYRLIPSIFHSNLGDSIVYQPVSPIGQFWPLFTDMNIY